MSSSHPASVAPRPNLPVYIGLFFVSGATALVYEVLWLRDLALIFGSTTAAASATLGAFMAGLGVGGYAGGRLASRHRAPLRLYCWLEIGVACAAVAVTPLLRSTGAVLDILYRADANQPAIAVVRALLAFLVLLPPTILMGATLPALAQAVVRTPRVASLRLGLLYGSNTIGAAAGAFWVGFVGISTFGTEVPRWMAVAANVVIGVIAFAFQRGVPPLEISGEPRRPETAAPRPRSRDAAWLPIAVYGVTGAVALACEVVWTRTLVFFTGSTTYAFTMMLAVLLVGLAIGGLVMGALGGRIRRRHAALAAVLAGTALSSVAGFAVVPSVAEFLQRWALPDPAWSRVVISSAGIAAVALLGPSIGFGAVFPLVTSELVVSGQTAAAAAGRAYAANLLGAVSGAFLSGFILIPAFGLAGSLRVLSGILLAVAMALAWHEPNYGASARIRAVLLAGLVALAAPVMWLTIARPLHRPSAGEALVHYVEGANATVSILADQTGAKTLFIDRISVAGTDPVMQTDQKSLAHLPVLLHPDPRRALTVGFGSGGASWSYTRYHELERIDCVEIAPEVLGAAPYLREANHDVFADPRYRVILDDARAYLQHTDARYDIIATDCTDLRYKGNASLYTSEYFGLCRRRLAPRGLTVVWMPLGGLSDDVFRMALNTFASVFPAVSVWYMNNYPTHYLLLVGSEDPHAIGWERLLRHLEEPAVRSDLDSIGLGNPFRLLATHLLDDAAVRAVVNGAALNSDRWPRLEFLAPRSADLFSGARNLESLLEVAARRDIVPPFVTQYGERQRRTVLDQLAPYRRAASLLNRGHARFQTGLQEFETTIDYYRRAAAANPADGQIPALIRATEQTRDVILAAYRRAAAVTPDDPGLLHNLGLTQLAAGNARDAAATFERLARLNPTLVDAQLNLSRAAAAAGDLPRARRAIGEASRLAPDRFDVQFQRGIMLQADGDLTASLAAYRAAAARRPSLAEAHFNAGTVLAMLGRPAEARAEYETGLARNPDEPLARLNYAQLLLVLGDRAGAARELQQVIGQGGAPAAKAQELLNAIPASR